MSKHTPAPWKAEYRDYGDEIWFGGEGCGMWSVGPAYLGGDGETPEGRSQMEADARLIAAAPDLLEALKYALPLVEKWCHTQGNMQSFHDEKTAPIRAAIAKAQTTEDV